MLSFTLFYSADHTVGGQCVPFCSGPRDIEQMASHSLFSILWDRIWPPGQLTPDRWSLTKPATFSSGWKGKVSCVV